MSSKLGTISAWLTPILGDHKAQASKKPFILALSGVQGCGKSTLVTHLQADLMAKGFRTAQLSLDDLYLTFREQSRLSDGGNRLWASRGQFGTHDTELAESLFTRLANLTEGSVAIPFYDKSLHDGRGDRAPEGSWTTVDGPLDVIIFEGWGVGFQALSETQLKSAFESAHGDPHSQVSKHTFGDLRDVNDALKRYSDTFMGPQSFDALVLLQAQETTFVYDWRLQQEHAMWAVKGRGMTDDQVKAFVDRYYTSYELYLPRLISGMFTGTKQGRQLNLRMDKTRQLVGFDVL
ncbi:protein of unknown function [Taphrina deformans PYCC 5710]|uniref:P-loop containing nucleoside triphosphate hydrolase protein n=1 Tax=Taphrina deformans (strain PYCC 5710 / ATCC 11124 / CBS 356.35 / IMI 108563 / JCM 9778 / NBRC 8474) TaxID=1097556 RepID=R4XK49_TAPDE|nr:protein of unknown function [Taphrina deformans PYCC 5710]|eukprot:CCG83693.1 protein of unknown function [Taphrina deformans PYCC 5710]